MKTPRKSWTDWKPGPVHHFGAAYLAQLVDDLKEAVRQERVDALRRLAARDAKGRLTAEDLSRAQDGRHLRLPPWHLAGIIRKMATSDEPGLCVETFIRTRVHPDDLPDVALLLDIPADHLSQEAAATIIAARLAERAARDLGSSWAADDDLYLP